MAYIQVESQRVINACKKTITRLLSLREKIDADYLADYQKPSLWNLWRGTKTIPDDYHTWRYGGQLNIVQNILHLAECASVINLSTEDVRMIGFTNLEQEKEKTDNETV